MTENLEHLIGLRVRVYTEGGHDFAGTLHEATDDTAAVIEHLGDLHLIRDSKIVAATVRHDDIEGLPE